MDKVVLHVSDWNYQEKYYEMPLDLLQEFAKKVKRLSLDEAWDWFTSQVNYGGQPSLPIRRCDDSTDHTLEEYFFDYERPQDSINDWGIE